MKKRILSVFLIFSLMIPCFAVPASAALALPGGVAASGVGVIQSASLASGARSFVEAIAGLSGQDPETVEAILNYLVSVTGYGNLGHSGLQAACNRLNQIAANPDKYARLMYEDGISIGYEFLAVDFEWFYAALVQAVSYGNDLVDGWHVVNSTQYGYVIANQSETFILADSVGRYPYAEEVTDKWLGSRTALSATTVNLATDYSLKNLQSVHQDLHPDWSFRRTNVTLQDGKYTVLQAASDGIHYDQILCDSLGFPYGIPLNNTQMGNDRDYNNDKEGQPEVSDEPIVDIDANLVYQMFPDGSFTWNNNTTYDMSNKTYYVDSSTTYNEGDNYYSYTWHYTYHIDYTSITYIGQTAEYDEVYEYYYQLPDGRSSADLTADELLALNTQIDVLPYIRSADDTSIRALYHFDGDTRDSSYWSHLGEFTWNKGASITYMDAGAFNGALYLDENAHNFSVKLPSNLGSGDWTVQFRYYQSHTLTPSSDSSITIGGVKVASMDGSAITVGGTSAPISVGQWQELAFMRSGSQYHFFHNGVLVKSVSTTAVFSDTIDFVFGSDQQTYKYFDELRVINKAVYPTTGYTPSSVPYDTNLALVLPDSQLPVADEYWSFKSSYENLLAPYGLDYAGSISTDSDVYFANSGYSSVTDGSFTFDMPGGDWETYSPKANTSGLRANVLAYINQTYLQFIADGDAAHLEHTSRVTNPDRLRFMSKYETRSSAFEYPANAFTIPIRFSNVSNRPWEEYYITDGDIFTISMVASDGSVGSLTFDCSASDDISQYFNGYTFRLYRGTRISATPAYTISLWTLNIYPTEVGAGGDFVYLELVDGDTTDLTAEFVSSVVAMDKDDLNTPSLAVRTDLDITGYQLGGVRPSLPEKGLVWALVESGRITSLQIYNGQAWEEVDGRIWTGSRWVPYYAYDVLLLKDMYDIVEADPTLNPIYTEAGFWSWLQTAWKDMISRLDAILVALGGETPGGSADESLLPGEEDDPLTEEDEGWQFIDLVVIIKDGVWTTVKGVVSTGVGGITSLASNITAIGDFFSVYNSDFLIGA